MKLDFEFPGWTKRESSDQSAWHIWPADDRIDHMASEHCPCSPKLEFRDADTDREVWIHFHEGGTTK